MPRRETKGRKPRWDPGEHTSPRPRRRTKSLGPGRVGRERPPDTDETCLTTRGDRGDKWESKQREQSRPGDPKTGAAETAGIVNRRLAAKRRTEICLQETAAWRSDPVTEKPQKTGRPGSSPDTEPSVMERSWTSRVSPRSPAPDTDRGPPGGREEQPLEKETGPASHLDSDVDGYPWSAGSKT